MKQLIKRLRSQRFLAVLGVCALLSLQLVVVTTSARGESQTVDEGAHLAAGYSYWITGDYRMNPEHPPLVKLMSSVPLLFLPIHFPLDRTSWDARNEWEFAHQLIYHNSVPAETILFWARFPIMLLGIALSFAVYRESRRLWGVLGAFLSLALVSLDPNLLAHSRYVTTDIGVTLFFFLTMMAFGRYLENPSRHRWWPVALWFSLAQVAKFSAVVLWPIFVVLWLLRWWSAQDAERHRFGVKHSVRFFAALLGISMLITWSLYGFTLSTPMQDPDLAKLYQEKTIWTSTTVDASHGLAARYQHFTDPRTTSGAVIQSFLTTVPAPAYMYYRGLLNVVFHNYWGHSSYLMGHYRVMGWWYYFPIAFLVKTPLPTLLILLGTFLGFFLHLRHAARGVKLAKLRTWGTFLRHLFSGRRFVYLTLLVPTLWYAGTSMASHLNLGVRHLFPIFPFLFVLAGSAVRPYWKHYRATANSVLVCLVIWLGFTSLCIYPHYLSYFSDAVGGAKNGPQYLTDSNIDWGQELKHLSIYLDQHNIPFVYILYFGQAQMDYYLKDYRYLPPSRDTHAIKQLDGWAAISVTALYGEGNDYGWLKQYTPTARIGNAIYLYDLRKKK